MTSGETNLDYKPSQTTLGQLLKVKPLVSVFFVIFSPHKTPRG